jgi:two-component system KDP operon response regulator KdpE
MKKPSSLTAPTARILVVDDEPHVRKFLRLSMQAEGFNVLEASTAEEAILLVHEASPELMVLDLGLPDIDGQQVIRDVRLKSDMPILVLSGRTEDSERIAALEQGADDFMTKPFNVYDLIARVRAALQQHKLHKNHKESGSIQTGELCIGLSKPEVMRARSAVKLDDEEYALLRLLALHGGRVLTFGRLMRALWGEQVDPTHKYRILQKRVNALRHKLETEPCFPRYIVTEPSVGYRLEIRPPLSDTP